MTEKYKAYYEKGYKTDISSINIKGDNITFEKWEEGYWNV